MTATTASIVLAVVAALVGGLAALLALRSDRHREVRVLVSDNTNAQRILVLRGGARSAPDFAAGGAGLAASLQDVMRSLKSQCEDKFRGRDFTGALAANDELLKLAREYDWSYSAELSPWLGDALTERSKILARLDRPEESLLAATQALQFYESLAEMSDFYLPDVAMGMNNRALRLKRLGRFEAALEALGEARMLYGRLLLTEKERYTAGLAAVNHNMALTFNDLGRRAEAIHQMEEVIHLYSNLERAHPGLYSKALALANSLIAEIRGDAMASGVGNRPTGSSVGRKMVL